MEDIKSKVNLQSWVDANDLGRYNKIKNHLQNEVFREKLTDGFVIRWILKKVEYVEGIPLELVE